jgi:hypothetical protein
MDEQYKIVEKLKEIKNSFETKNYIFTRYDKRWKKHYYLLEIYPEKRKLTFIGGFGDMNGYAMFINRLEDLKSINVFKKINYNWGKE